MIVCIVRDENETESCRIQLKLTECINSEPFGAGQLYIVTSELLQSVLRMSIYLEGRLV